MTSGLRCGPGSEKPLPRSPPSDQQLARGRQQEPRCDDRLRPRLHERRNGHHPGWVFPHGQLLDPTRREFSQAFPYCTVEQRRRARGNDEPGQAEAAKKSGRDPMHEEGMSSRGSGNRSALQSGSSTQRSVWNGSLRCGDDFPAVGKPDNSTAAGGVSGDSCAEKLPWGA